MSSYAPSVTRQGTVTTRYGRSGSSTPFEGDYQIVSPAVLAEEQRQRQDQERQVVVARQNNELMERQRALARQETALQQRNNALNARENALKQDQLAMQRKEEDLRKRTAELDRQRRAIETERQAVAEEREHTRRMEQQRRARRTNSEAFLEDTFPALQMGDMIKYIANPSARIRREAMLKLSPFTDYRNALRDQRGFDAVVLGLLPGAMPLIREGKEDVLEFVSTFLVERHFSQALAKAQQCPLLFELLLSSDVRMSSVGRDALTGVLAGDVHCITALYRTLLELLVTTPDERLVNFAASALPTLIPRALIDAQYPSIVPCVIHPSKAVRSTVYRPILHASEASATTRRGLVRAGLLTSIHRIVQAGNPPDDILGFTASFVPKFAVEICQEDQVEILLDLLCFKHQALTTACALALRSLRQRDASTRETIRIALDPYVWSNTGIDDRVRAFALESFQQMAADLLLSGHVNEFMAYLDLTDSSLRELFMVALIKSARDNTDLQKKLLDAGLLGKLLPYLVAPDIPSEILSSATVILPAFALQICRRGYTSLMFDLALHTNPTLSQAAIAALRRTLHGDKECHKAIETVLYAHLSPVPTQLHDFVSEALPALARDMIAEDRHGELLPGVIMDNPSLRSPVLAVATESCQNSPVQQKKFARSGIVTLLAKSLAVQDPPRDLLQSASVLFPLISPHLPESTFIAELIDLLGYPSSRQLAADCLMRIASSGLEGQQSLVEADVLRKLLPYTQNTVEPVETLICDLLPLLGVACCRKGQAGLLLQLATTTNVHIRARAMVAIKNVVAAPLIDRTKLRTVLLPRLGSNEEYLMDVASVALPTLAKDLIAEGELATVVELAMHAEPRIRQPVYPPLKEAIRDFPASRRSLISMGFFGVLVKFCSSPVRDRKEFACAAVPMLALDASRSGLIAELLDMFGSQDKNIRQTLQSALINIARGNQADQQALIDSDVLERLVTSLETASQSDITFCETLFPIIAPTIGRHQQASAIMLGLLSHKNVAVRAICARTLDSILNSSAPDRRGLKQAVMLQLHAVPPPILLQYCAKALSSVFCSDYLKEGSFGVLFELLAYPELEVRIAVSSCLRSSLQDSGMCEQLASAGLFEVTLTLLHGAPQDVLLFTAEAVLPALGPSLVDGRATCERLIALLGNEHKVIRDGAAVGLQRAAAASAGHRLRLVEEGLFNRLITDLNSNDSRGAELVGIFLPLLAMELAQAGKCDVMLDLLNTDTVTVRGATTQALQAVLHSENAKAQLLPPLLARSGRLTEQDSSFFSEAIVELSQAILLIGEEKKLLQLMWHDMPLVSEAAFSAIRGLTLHGTSFDQRKLLEAGLADQLQQLLRSERLRAPAMILALDILPVLADVMLELQRMDGLIQLLNDQEPLIPTTVDAAIRRLSGNPALHIQLVQQDIITRLFVVYDQRADDRVQNLICYLFEILAIQIIDFGKTPILVNALRRRELRLRYASVSALQKGASLGNESVKAAIILARDLLPGLLHILSQDRNNGDMMKSVCSIVADLGASDLSRSKAIIGSGIIPDLVQLCRAPDVGVQLSALRALYSLSAVAVGDKSVLLQSGLIPILTDFLKEPPDPRVAQMSLKIIGAFSAVPAYRSAIAKPHLLAALVQYMLPKDETQSLSRANQLEALEICRNIARESDNERRALLDGGVLLPLLHLTLHNQTDVVVLACSTVEALGQTGTFRQQLLNAEADKYLKRRTSLMHKNTLAAGQDKKPALKAAKQALDVLETGLFRGLSRKLSRSHPSTRKQPLTGHHDHVAAPLSPGIPEED